MNNVQKKSGFVIGGIFALCFSVLSIAEYRGMHTEYKEAWRISFVDPMSDQLDFTVQNDTVQTDFFYTIFADKKPISEGSFTLPQNRSKTVSLEELSVDPHSLEGKIRIRIKDATGGEREIFKILSEE